MKYLTNINLNGNQLERAKFQTVASLESVSNPFAGQHVWCTADNQEYVYDGTKWVNALSQGDYTFANGVQESDRQVSLKLASGEAAGNVELTANEAGLKANVAEASTGAKGIIEIATDEEAAAGASEVLAVNPKQLATKVAANTPITEGTHTKITYDAKGLVTGGEDLAASDIPDLDSSKITTLNSYAKGSVADIATSDSLNAALGKLEAKADEKVVANAAITGATKTKITYDSKGLVTAGADLAEEDIPALHLAKVTDVTATAAEVNKLAGLATTAEELGFVHGVTSSIQDQLNVKLELDDLSVAAGSANYMSYDNTNGQFSLKVDSTPTADSNNLVTSGGVKSYVDGKISTIYKAAGSVAFAGLPTLGAGYEGYVYNVTDAFTTTEDFVEGAGNDYPVGTNVVCINTAGSEEEPVYKWDVLAGFVDVSAFITASSTETLTNKTIDADNNIIVNLETDNLKSGVVATSIAAAESAVDTKLASEKAVRTELDKKQDLVSNATENGVALLNAGGQVIDSGKVVVTTLGPVSGEGAATDNELATAAAVRAAINAASAAASHKEVKAFAQSEATFSNGQVVWTFANPLSDADVIVQVKQSDNEVVIADVDTDSSTITITFNAEAMPADNAYKAVIIS